MLSFHQNVIYLILALLMAVLFSLVDFKAEMHPVLPFMVRPWAVPMKIDLGFVLAMGPLVTSSMYLFSLAYRIGPASFVAPFEYSGMIWAVVFGLLFWGDAKLSRPSSAAPSSRPPALSCCGLMPDAKSRRARVGPPGNVGA